MNVIDKFDLRNQLVVITGGAGLLGNQHAESIIEANGDVVILDIDEKKLNKQKIAFKDKYDKQIHQYKVDISNESDVLQVNNQIQRDLKKNPNILINNAAIDAKFDHNSDFSANKLEFFDIQRWNRELSVGLTGALICSKVFGTEMSKNNFGVIINIASHYGLVAPNNTIYVKKGEEVSCQNVKPVSYPVIKHGIIGLTKYIATYWADKGIRCNSLAPGGVYNDHDEEFVKKFSKLTPMGRMANIDEYKAALVFLCSDASSYMNGSILTLDGGLTAW